MSHYLFISTLSLMRLENYIRSENKRSNKKSIILTEFISNKDNGNAHDFITNDLIGNISAFFIN